MLNKDKITKLTPLALGSKPAQLARIIRIVLDCTPFIPGRPQKKIKFSDSNQEMPICSRPAMQARYCLKTDLHIDIMDLTVAVRHKPVRQQIIRLPKYMRNLFVPNHRKYKILPFPTHYEDSETLSPDKGLKVIWEAHSERIFKSPCLRVEK